MMTTSLLQACVARIFVQYEKAKGKKNTVFPIDDISYTNHINHLSLFIIKIIKFPDKKSEFPYFTPHKPKFFTPTMSSMLFGNGRTNSFFAYKWYMIS